MCPQGGARPRGLHQGGGGVGGGRGRAAKPGAALVQLLVRGVRFPGPQQPRPERGAQPAHRQSAESADPRRSRRPPATAQAAAAGRRTRRAAAAPRQRLPRRRSQRHGAGPLLQRARKSLHV